MPIRVSALVADHKPVAVVFGDDTLNLTYKPSAVNAVQEERELADRKEGRHLFALAQSLSEVIDSWDLQDDDGNALPPTVDTLKPLGLDALQKINRVILADLLPNQTPSATSSNGSSAAAS